MRTKKILFLVSIITSGCVILILLLSIAIYIFLLLPPVQRYILTVAKPLYENVFNGKTTIGGIKSDLLSYVIIQKIEIRDTVNHESSVFIDNVRIDFWSPALIFGKISISSVIVNNVSLNMSIQKDHQFAFPAMPRGAVSAEPDTKKTWNVEIGPVKIKKLGVVYKDSSSGVFASVKDAGVEVDFYRIDSLLLSVNGYKNSVKTPWWSGKIDTLSVASIISPRGAIVKTIYLKGPALFSQTSGSLPFDTSDNYNLNTLIRADLRPFFKNNRSSQWITGGVMTVKAYWGGTLQKPIFLINADGYKVQTERILVNSINIGCKYKDRRMSFSTNAQSGDLKGIFSGECEISEIFSDPRLGKYSATLSFEGQAVSAQKMFFPGTKTIKTGIVYVTASASGMGLGLPDKSIANVVIRTNKNKKENFATNMQLKNHIWKIDGSWVDNKISGEGYISEDLLLAGKLKLHFPEVEPVALTLTGQNVSGHIESDLTFSGKLPALQINSELKCENVVWNDLTLSTLSGKINYKDNVVFVENLDASVNGKCDSVLRMLDIDSCGGNVDLDIKAHGALSDLNVDATIRGTDVYYKQIVAHTILADFNFFGKDSISLQKVVVENDKSRIAAGGMVVLKPEIEFNLKAKTEMKSGASHWNPTGDLQINAVLAHNEIKGALITSDQDISIVNQWYPLPYTVLGLLTSNLDVTGTIHNPKLKAVFELKNAGYENFKLRNVSGSVNIFDSVVNSKILIFVSDTLSHIQVDATLPLRPQQNWSIDESGDRKKLIVITSDTFNIADIGLNEKNTYSINGLARGKLTLTGIGAGWELDGNVNLLGDEFSYEPYDVNVKGIYADLRILGTTDNPDVSFKVSSGETNVSSEVITSTRLNGRFKEKNVYIDSASLEINHRDALMLNGQVSLVPMDALLSKSESFIKYKMVALPLKLLELIAPDIYISGGVIDGDGMVFVKNGRLQSDGLLSLTNGVVESELIDQKIGPFKGNLVFRGDSVVLDNFSGRVDKGSFNLAGKAELLSGGILGLSLTLKGKNINLDAQDLLKLQMQTVELHLRNGKDRKHYLIDGKINFGPTRFIRDVQISDIMTQSKSQNEKVMIKSIYDSIDLRLDLQFQDNLYIDMNLGNMQLEGGVAATGTVAKPAFTGEINAVQGDVFYLDRKFEINKGNINFVSPTELNPSIYLDAKTEVNTFTQGTSQNVTYTIKLIVSGNLEHPVVALTSDPALDEPNIVSVLTLGTTMGSVGGDIASRIGSMVGNKFLGFGTKSLEKLLGLESISVSGNIFDSKDSLNGPQLSVTKRLSDRLTLSYESMFGASNQQKFSVLYRIFPFLFLTGQTETSGDSRIILKFRTNR
jgi:hypothetical protein